MTVLQIRRGRVEDAERLAAFAARTFEETFAAANDPGDMALYLQTTYGLPQQSAELADPGVSVVLVEADGELAGYAQLRQGPAPRCVDQDGALELQRFYVDRAWHGSGVARTLMEEVLREARHRGARALWLGVWERNARAIAFYRKHGFADVGSQPFLLGDDRQTDRVMARPVSAEPDHLSR